MATISWERYVFRLMKQGEKEPLISFYERLRNQTESCKFVDTESQLKDQILQKCIHDELRKKAFEKEMSLEQILLTGETLEEAKKNYGNGGQSSSSTQEVRCEMRATCTRCGSKELFHAKKSCPAFVNNILCGNCKRRGHFQDFCQLPKKFGNKRMRSISQESDDLPIAKFQRANSSLLHPKFQQNACKANPSSSKGKNSIQVKDVSKNQADTVKSSTRNKSDAISNSPFNVTSCLNARPLNNSKESPSTNDPIKGTGDKLYKSNLIQFSSVARIPKIALNSVKQKSSKREEINPPQGPSRVLDLTLSDNKLQSKPMESSKANDKADAIGINVSKIETIITSSSGTNFGNQIKKMESSKIDLTSSPNIGVPKSDEQIKK